MPDIHGTDKAPGTEHGFRRLIFRAMLLQAFRMTAKPVIRYFDLKAEGCLTVKALCLTAVKVNPKPKNFYCDITLCVVITMLGILLASIGMDTLSGSPRYDFGSMYLLGPLSEKNVPQYCFPLLPMYDSELQYSKN